MASEAPLRWHYSEFDDSSFRIRGRTLFFMLVIFSVILIATLLFLYGRWICRFCPPPTPSAAPVAPPPPTRLDPVTITSLPIVLYRSSAAEAAECSICLGIFGEEDEVKKLPPCKHWFHSECVDKWLNRQSTCPLCRASLRVDSLV